LDEDKIKYTVDELKEIRAIQRNKSIADISHALINGAVWVSIVFIIFEGVTAFAGKESTAVLSVFADLNANEYFLEIITTLFGSGGIFYGYRQSRLRKKDIERLVGRIKELEEKIDPERSSSGLDSKGENLAGD